ncbi:MULTISPECIES: twin-arginine translocase TatA/TatE family subunit [Aeromonas]|jgi:sec-independent protein translocase protein TatA|uniref:Sec-independent protein translocase protein TatA n=1 Tax=Aeromonas eucrenophila TaxID=649 RepID=A0ABW0YBV9_9GAMM|nr:MULTISPECIES: twin-arginine translocase TatA/TatE family subunit [Aeromonas]
MGLGGIHIWHLLILLVVVVLVFGSKRLASAGEDLGTAIKDFRKALRDDDTQPK